MTSNKAFLGSGWSFPPEFRARDKMVQMVSEDEDIKDSLRILLSTSPGERIMHPSYGCGIKSLVFGSITESAMTEITDLIEKAVLFFEPRINLESVEMADDEVLHGVLRIQLNYTIIITNRRSNMVYPFYFQEGTGPIS